MDVRVFITNNLCGGKTKMTEGQKERERECVRDRALLEERDSVGNKIDNSRKHVAQMCKIN
jgi:hypothetical protein